MTTTRQPRRYSEGMEHVPGAPSVLRVGRYSDGLAPDLIPTADVIGSYADGLVRRPDASGVLAFGSYGDCEKPQPAGRQARRVAEVAPARA